MGKSDTYASKANQSRLSGGGAQSSAYASKSNLSRQGAPAGKSTPYTSRVNVSRLSGINADAFVRNASLLSRMGGETVLENLVRIFYGKALHDDRVADLFDAPDSITMEKQVQDKIAFLKVELGGYNDGSVDVREAYRKLAALNITDEQYDTVLAGIFVTMQGQYMPPPIITEVEEHAEVMRKLVVR